MCARRDCRSCSRRCAAPYRSMHDAAAFAEPCGRGHRSRRAAARSTACSAASRVEDILEAARSRGEAGDDWVCGATAATIRAKSPTSLKIALAQVRRGRDWSFEECMRAEFRIVSRIVHGHDFYEGRARRDRRQGQLAALEPCDARRGERRGRRAVFRAARRGRVEVAMSDPRPARSKPRSRASATPHGRGGWCCSCASWRASRCSRVSITGRWCSASATGRLDLRSATMAWQAATIFFAVIDLVAAVWLVARRRVGRRGLADRLDLDGGDRAVLSAGLRRPRVDRDPRVHRDLLLCRACADGRARTAGVIIPPFAGRSAPRRG